MDSERLKVSLIMIYSAVFPPLFDCITITKTANKRNSGLSEPQAKFLVNRSKA